MRKLIIKEVDRFREIVEYVEKPNIALANLLINDVERTDSLRKQKLKIIGYHTQFSQKTNSREEDDIRKKLNQILIAFPELKSYSAEVHKKFKEC